MKPIFTIRYITDRVVPATVEFEEIAGRIQLWNYGDGKFGYYDTPDQTKIQHTYNKSGTFKVFAKSKDGELSDPIEVTILPGSSPEPAPEPTPAPSLWGLFVAWLKKLLGMK